MVTTKNVPPRVLRTSFRVPSGRPADRLPAPPAPAPVSNVAIEPGTNRAFVTASGPGGGYIYTFPALASAPAGSPNGG